MTYQDRQIERDLAYFGDDANFPAELDDVVIRVIPPNRREDARGLGRCEQCHKRRQLFVTMILGEPAWLCAARRRARGG